MAKELSEQLNRLGHKAELLVTRFGTLRDDNQRLQQQVEDLAARLSAEQAKNARMADELRFLRMSSVIATNNDDARQLRTLLSNLVREIDTCVADLMKDI